MKLKIYIDEAWRGPLAGPVCVGLLMPIGSFEYSDFDDSKKLKESKREIVYDKIQRLEDKSKLLYSFWYADNKEIDKFGIVKALNVAMKRWLVVLYTKFAKYIESTILDSWNWDLVLKYLEFTKKISSKTINYNKNTTFFKDIQKLFTQLSNLKWIILDGNSDFWVSKDIGYKLTTIIKWDSKVPFIWWASIVAKVERDHYMISIASKYKKYWFEKHKWYGTLLHRNMIKKHWKTPIHRSSFLKNLIYENKLPQKSPWKN